MQTLLDTLKKELGEQVVLTGTDIGERYQGDWSDAKPLLPSAVLRPASTADIATILKTCYAAGQKIVVQGGLTGLAGSATPRADEIAISLERLTGIEELDADSMTMTVRAGTPLQAVQEAAKDAGFTFPLDLGARGSCNIGGNVSTNAGGTQVIRYGMMRNLILGMEVVLPEGTVITSLNKMLKNNAGYDLKHLFIGTEGTLGIVTRLVLRLFPTLTSTCTALCAFDNFRDVISLLQKANTRLAGNVSSYEVMWANYYDYATTRVSNVRSPFDSRFPVYAILESEGGDQEQDMQRFESLLGDALESGLIKDAVIAQSGKEAAEIWDIRHAIAEIIPQLKPFTNTDISVPISRIDAFVNETSAALQKEFPGISLFVFGHIGDGNIHFMAKTDSETDKAAVEKIIYGMTSRFHGSISAEHGIGILKKEFLSYSRTPEEIELMRKIKNLIDPKGILNQSRIF